MEKTIEEIKLFQLGWVKATPRTLPDENVGVLVFIPEEDNHVTAGMWDVSQKWVLLDDYRVPDTQITYWRFLPPIPDDLSYEKSHASEKDDTQTETIRTLQKQVFTQSKVLEECEKAIRAILPTAKVYYEMLSKTSLGHQEFMREDAEDIAKAESALQSIENLKKK